MGIILWCNCKMSRADAKQGEKSRREEICRRVIRIQHGTLDNIAQPAKLCMAIITKGSLAQKGHNLLDCNRFDP